MGEWALLEGLPPEDRHKVLQATRRRVFARNEVVFHEGDPGADLHLIVRGRFAVQVGTPLGELATLTVLGRGDFFGELALVSEDHVRTATVVALERAETRALHRVQFEQLRRHNPWVDRVLVQTLGARLASLNALLLEALYLPADKRLVRRLVSLCRIYGGDASPPVIRLTQEEIATTAGVTRPTANRVLRVLERDGVIGMRRGSVAVLRMDELQRRSR
jgi:CRP/FNR family transcriptional regulator, cyclic AMP receptor protein